MKLLYLALPLLGSLVIAQSLVEDDCQCPMVKCPASDTFEGCRCTNLAELRCKQRCPKYKPKKFKICTQPRQTSTLSDPPAVPTLPILGFPTPALPVPVPPPAVELPDKPLVPGCVCEEMMCIQSYPASCHCAYGIAQACWAKCGGKSPGVNTCPPAHSFGGIQIDGPVKRVAAPEPQETPKKLTQPFPSDVPVLFGLPRPKPCKCEDRPCIKSFPAGCICDNANKHACWKKCGGLKPAYGSCSPPKKPTPYPIGGKHKVQSCGGFRVESNKCPTGYICVDDPYREGCGMACDAPGICVKDQMCGGFAGFRCPEEGQVCADNPTDGCDPKNGGADCGGLCVWPPELRSY